MIQRISKRLAVLLLGLLLCLALPSCSAISSILNLWLTPIRPPEELSGEDTGDFDRYIEYLNGLPEKRDELSEGRGYKVTACPVQEGDEIMLKIEAVNQSLTLEGEAIYTETLALMIPEGGQNARFAYAYSDYNDDGSPDHTVSASGTLNTSEYTGTLPEFTEFTDSKGHYNNAEEIYLEIATEEMEALLSAASSMLDRASLPLSALGFTYTHVNTETN
jgi:hypothetical protein